MKIQHSAAVIMAAVFFQSCYRSICEQIASEEQEQARIESTANFN
jgi:hypothetical protein